MLQEDIKKTVVHRKIVLESFIYNKVATKYPRKIERLRKINYLKKIYGSMQQTRLPNI